MDLAKKLLVEALQKKPRLEPALNALGLVYAYQRDFINASTTLNRLIQISPKFYDAYNLLGTVYTELGNYELAKEKLLVAANAEEYLTPENAFVNLAVLEIKFEKYDSALRYVEKGMLLNRRFAPLYNLNGLALENLGKLAEASENYEKAIGLVTSPDPGYLINSARVLSRLGDKKKALDKLELALGKSQDPDIVNGVTTNTAPISVFDELIPLPDGTSYNAYLVRGADKTALIDTVDPSKTGDLLENLQEAGVARIDYIVSQHAEQDHSGSVGAILEIFPQAVVVTNEKCKAMLMELLEIPEKKFQTVEDGHTLDLGGKTLEFIFAPWVHWPETMSTYWTRRSSFVLRLFGSHLATRSCL